MIALLRGVLLEKHPNQAIVEAGGVGYDVQIPVSTFSALPATADLVSAIRESRIDQLVRIPGVGKKTAERIVLELKDKLDILPGVSRPAAAPAADSWSAIERDVMSALLNLGCNRAAAEAAVRKAKPEGATEFEPL